MSAHRVEHGPVLGLGRFAAYVGIACGIITLFALAWVLRDVVLIAFGALVFAAVIRALAWPFHCRLGLREGWSVALIVVVLVISGIGLSWLFGRQIGQQLHGLSERLPRAVAEVRDWIEAQPVGQFVLTHVSGMVDGGGSLAGVQKFAAVGVGTIGHAVVMFFGGIFLAANPALYLDGFLRLFPPGYRPTLRDALVESGGALRKWLLGQLVAMLCIGTLTGVGLRLVGAPLPLVLGIIAGLLNFIPILGPVIAFGPGVLVALTDSPQTAIYAALVYIVVQELEGHVITPLAQRWAVKLPPAFGLFAVLSFALLFGFFGVLFGMPLAVVVRCLVRKLYVEDGLEKSPARPRPARPAVAEI
jgi:predicted PurR-regulated permease PerM